MLRLKHGDIYNPKTLHKIQDITLEVNILPGVDHNEIFSLASYRVNFYARAVPGALISTIFMYPLVPETQEHTRYARSKIVDAHREPSPPFINDDKGAVVPPALSRTELDYKALFEGCRICQKYSDDNTEILWQGCRWFPDGATTTCRVSR